MRTSIWLRWVLGALASAFLLAAVLAASLALGLRSAGFRHWLLSQVGDRVEARSGIRIAARDFGVGIMAGRLAVDELQLSAGSGREPFITAERATATLRWSSLLGDVLVLPSLVVERPHLDLGAPLPGSKDDETESTGFVPPALEILNLSLTGGSVESARAPPERDIWFDRWRLDAIDLEGSYLDGLARIEVAAGRLAVESHRRPPLLADLRGSARLEESGALALESFELAGEGLELRASGEGALGGTEVPSMDFELRVDLGHLLPDLTSAGAVDAHLRLEADDGGLSGTGRIRVRDLPGDLLGPWVEQASRGRLDPSNTSVDGDADIEIRLAEDLTSLRAVRGEATLAWRRGDRSLLDVQITAGEPGDESAENFEVVTFAVRALPAWPGSRFLSGALLVPSWEALETAELRQVRLDVRVDDLARDARALGLKDGPLEDWGVAGELRLTARAEGPVLTPRLEADASWSRDGKKLLAASVRSRGEIELGGVGPVTLDFAASFLPAAPGRRDFSGALHTTDWTSAEAIELLDAGLTLNLPDLAALRAELVAGWPALSRWLPPQPDLLTGSLGATLTASGPLSEAVLKVAARWEPGPGESVVVEGSGRPVEAAPFFDGRLSARARVEALDLSRLDLTDDEGRPLTGKLSAEGSFEGTLEAFAARLTASGSGVGYAGGLEIEDFRLEATADAREAVAEFSLTPGGELGSGIIEGTARVELEWPLTRGEARLTLLDPPVEALERVDVELRLAGGSVEVDPLRLYLADPDAPPASIRATIPLGALGSLPGAEELLAALAIDPDPGSVTLRVETLQMGALWDQLTPVDVAVSGTLSAELALDPAAPTALRGEIRIDDLLLEGEDERLSALEPARITAADGRLALRPLRWVARGQESAAAGLKTSGELRLSQDWKLGDTWLEAVEHAGVSVTGAIRASLLNPFLGGGVASGELEIDVRLGGPLDEISGTIRLDGPDVVVRYQAPYLMRCEAPALEASVREGELTIERARADVNRGEIRLTGGGGRAKGIDLGVEIEGARLRLDLGLTMLMSADLGLNWYPGATARLTGDLVLERGVVRRDLLLDRELLHRLLGPPKLESLERGAFDDMELDLSLSTVEGVRVQNNLADLQADWSSLRIRGTVGQPLVRGRIDLDPGGRITAYGQTVRIDEGSLTLTGDPELEPRLVLETTSSLDDPALGQDDNRLSPTGWGDRGSWDTGFSGPGSSGGIGAMTTGLTDHYTDRLASLLGGSLPSAEISYKPLPLFGETDTEARWTLSQWLSPRLRFITSRNPRRAEGTTNLVELSSFNFAPDFIGQLFRNDLGNNGATLQQVLHFGGGAKAILGDRHLRRIRVEAPKGISARQIRQATGFRRGDAFPEGSDFDAEVDVTDFLRRSGFPAAEVRASERGTGSGLVELRVTVDPGPEVRVEFEGDRPSRGRRRDIAVLYQPERLTERSSLEEMRRATIRALRAEGFLDPIVEFDVAASESDEEPERRVVRVRSDGGRRVDPAEISFLGVDGDAQAHLESLFNTRLERLELAAGAPGADAFLQGSLRRIGYLDAAVNGRRLSADGTVLTVSLDSGVRRRIGRIAIEGVSASEEERLKELLPISIGEPVLNGDLSRATARIDEDFRSRGHADVRVDLAVEDLPDREAESRVVFTVEPGSSYRVAEVRLVGLGATRPAWAEGVAAMEVGSVLTANDIGEARRRLHRTGVFQRISSASEPLGHAAPEPPDDPPNGPQDGAQESVGAAVVFELEERPRYALSYGGRWESGESVGGALYLLDRNFLGRGRSLGLRGIYNSETSKSFGLYHAWPRIGGTRALFELFGEALTETDIGIITEGVESWAQVTLPLSPRRQMRFYTQFQDRTFEAEDPDPNDPLDEDATNLFFGWQAIFDSLDRAVGRRSEHGLYVGLDLSVASEALGSDFSETRLFAQGKLFLPVGPARPHRLSEGRMLWAQSVRVGFLEAFAGEIPRADRLRAGGEFSVRGYATETLGPLDADGVPLGGEVLLVINEEIHLPVWKDLRAVAFFDAGNVWESRGSIDAGLFTSVGLGLRSPSPIGPLRLDLAHALDRRRDIDPEFKVYFGLGATF